MPYLLLPSDHVPDEGTVRHKAKEHDDNDGDERGSAEYCEGHNWVDSEAMFPDTERQEQENAEN